AHQVVIGAELGARRQLAHLPVLALQRRHHVRHVDDATVRRGQEGAIERDVLDVGARQLETLGQKVQVQVGGARRRGREYPCPQKLAMLLVGDGKLDRVLKASGEGRVQVFEHVR